MRFRALGLDKTDEDASAWNNSNLDGSLVTC